MKKVCVYKQQPNRNIPCPYIKVSPIYLITFELFRMNSEIVDTDYKLCFEGSFFTIFKLKKIKIKAEYIVTLVDIFLHNSPSLSTLEYFIWL